MSVIVEPTALGDHVAARPDVFVMSVGSSGAVKVMHARVELGDGPGVRVQLGPGGVRNANERPAITLLWPDVGDGFSLLADAQAVTTEVPAEGRAWVAATVTAAVLHKAPAGP